MGNSTYYLLPRSLSPLFNLYSCQKKSEKKVVALFKNGHFQNVLFWDIRNTFLFQKTRKSNLQHNAANHDFL